MATVKDAIEQGLPPSDNTCAAYSYQCGIEYPPSFRTFLIVFLGTVILSIFLFRLYKDHPKSKFLLYGWIGAFVVSIAIFTADLMMLYFWRN
jgi:hypothetical protein